MPRILIRPRARGDLIEIWNYIADDGEVQAEAFIATIDRKFEMLAKRPLAGRRRDELSAALEARPLAVTSSSMSLWRTELRSFACFTARKISLATYSMP